MDNSFDESELMDFVERSRSMRIERQELLDRLWVLEEDSRKLQEEFFKKIGNHEVGLVFKMISGSAEVTGIEVKPKKQKK